MLDSFAPRVVCQITDQRVGLAEDLREELEREGAEVLGLVPTVEEALELLRSEPKPYMAIVDINL